MTTTSTSPSWIIKVKVNPATPAKITFIGCGNLGSALLNRWLDSDLNLDISVIKPSPIEANITYYDTIPSGTKALKHSNLVILAIKPQILDTICTDLKPHIAAKTPILSIAAGKTLPTLENLLHPNQPIIRTMPNTPSMIGQGATVTLANQHTTTDTKTLVTALFEKTGLLAWITDESLIDAITALSASGPAYLYYFTESLAQAAIETGLPTDLANALAKQTIIGASALAADSPDTIQTLREKVTSKGGVTAAALETLMDGTLTSFLTNALNANINRSKELNQE